MQDMILDEMKDTDEAKNYEAWKNQVEQLEEMLFEAKRQKFAAWDAVKSAWWNAQPDITSQVKTLKKAAPSQAQAAISKPC